MKDTSGPLSLPGGVVCAALFLLGALALPAGAAGDDFEFAEKLIEAKLFDLARKVYDAILADEARSAADRDRTRYLCAILRTAEASAA